jgi:hypothetical protein
MSLHLILDGDRIPSILEKIKFDCISPGLLQHILTEFWPRQASN